MVFYKVFHLASLAVYLFSIWYDLEYVDIPFMKRSGDIKFFKGRLKFLTIWNMVSDKAVIEGEIHAENYT